MIGRDVRRMSTSWAQAAGGAIASARDVDRWMRAVFEGRVVPPKQQSEWMALVSTKTGEPITEVSVDDPRGFSLGLSRAIPSDRRDHNGSIRVRRSATELSTYGSKKRT